MIFLNESKFGKFNGETGRALVNSFIYVLSKSLDLEEQGNALVGNDKLISLRPSAELLEQFKSGDISKAKFKKAYFKELSSKENKFIIYTIIRSLNEKRYLPIFICSDEDWDLGFMKLLSKFLTKKFGLKAVDPKKYTKGLKELWKEAKHGNKKGKETRKAFKKLVKSYIKDQVQLSLEGIERLEDMEKEFAITRIVILVNQAPDDSDEISKKTIIKAIGTYSEFNKKAKKAVKEAVHELGISKKSDRWSRKDAISLAIQVYNNINADEPKAETKKSKK